ncbi:MAG TPA: dTMP kinase [Planctomycetota bacterium]|nr:dTMP kinase [Planctomycetota bacterium]
MENSPQAPSPVFIDFEGIDGSGKTTLSNRIAELLKRQGITVYHARDGGIFRSEISKEIRTLTRDPRFLRMSNVTEFFLYVARDTQIIDEFIRPKLLPGNVVLSDRYLYSAITHSHHARGLDRKAVDGVLDLAARGLWPDLVVYCDVDPLTSRIRKKIQKVREQRLGDFGRKGLMGIGFREEMRRGFLELAKEDPERWLVIDNAKSTIPESLLRIYERIMSLLRAKGHRMLEPSALGLNVAAPAGVPSILEGGVRKVLSFEDPASRKDAVCRLFFDELDRLAGVNPSYAALFLSGIDTPEANALRERILDREPAMVAHGLQGLRSPESMKFRQRLKEKEPVYVARSLAGLPELPENTALRLELLEKAPAQIALSLRGVDTDLAWEIRETIGKKAAREVLISVRGLASERAWALREKRSRERFFPPLLESLGGIDTPQAWQWRTALAEEFLPWVLMSLRGVDCEEAWLLREEHIERAPKIIIKTLGRSDEPRAWRLRNMAKHFAKEVLDSLSGIDNAQAWALRMELREKWPNTVVSSLGAGAQSERAWKLRWDMLRAYPENLLLLKHMLKATLRTIDLEDEYLDDDDDDGDFT